MALDLARDLEPTASNIQRVAALTDQETAAWAFTQWRLRRKAKQKFELADRMLFVAEALEQATHEQVARYHASRFPKGVPVVDLTCGIGGDLIALARRGPAIGYETDNERLECARHNLEVHGLYAETRHGDGTKHGACPYALADPSRRVEGKRTLDLKSFEPNPFSLVDHLNKSELACMKLSPMIPDPQLESLAASIEFVSFGGECREALLWFGRSAPRGRYAIHIESGERLEAEGVVPATGNGRYFYEADPAAVRAHCLGTLCQRHRLKAVGDSNGYLAGDSLVQSPWLTPFEALQPCLESEQTVRRWLKENDAQIAAVKTKGVRLDPHTLATRLRTVGRLKVELAVYPNRNKFAYAILKRI